ncbi:MAG: glycoside hydrolase family 3 C-terminal domain-containing protein [Coriobacteriales bacterium]
MENADSILANMTTAEKAELICGRTYWRTCSLSTHSVPSLFLSDGSNGLRKQVKYADHFGIGTSVPAVCYPTASALGCTFDPQLIEQLGSALGEECRKEHVSVLLGPAINIKRHPLGGRNFEYYSEDPLLSGKLGAAFIRGVQAQGVGCAVKHFACNNQEHLRMCSDSVVDDRALNEIYLRPFELAVKEADPWLFMAAYNKVNGEHATENRWLLTDKLRGEWGFKGAVVTDWGALNEHELSVRAGLDLVMPGPNAGFSKHVADAADKDEKDAEALDRAAGNVLKLCQRHLDGMELDFDCDTEAHLALARDVATESAVLLENDGTLPLRADKKIAVIGAYAKEPRYQGGGSSHVVPIELDSPFEALSKECPKLVYAEGYSPDTGATSNAYLKQAARAARRADTAVVFLGLPGSIESEGHDRETMRLPKGAYELVDRVMKANKKTVVVLMVGSPVELNFAEKPAAILLTHLAGCQNGAACADLLLGHVSPSGKLAETWPKRVEDTALGTSLPSKKLEVLYRESIYVGYRYFDTAKVEPAYPFGHGLSYTRFDYSELSVELEEDGVHVSFKVKNVGGCYGAEAAQVYLHVKAPAIPMPDQELVGFEKVLLAPRRSERIELVLKDDAFRHWDSLGDRWRIDAGAYEIRVGSSSRDIRLRDDLRLDESCAAFPVEKPPLIDPIERQELESYTTVVPHGFSDEEFALLYGRELPKEKPLKPFTRDSLLQDLEATKAGRVTLHSMYRIARKVIGNNATQIDIDTLLGGLERELPVRALSMAGIPNEAIEGLLIMLNGQHVKGLSMIKKSMDTLKK